MTLQQKAQLPDWARAYIQDIEGKQSAAEAELLRVRQELAKMTADYNRSGLSGVCIQQLMLNGTITPQECDEMMQGLSSEEWHQYHKLPAPEPPQQPEPQGGGRVGVGQEGGGRG